MPHHAVTDAAHAVSVQPGAVVSKVISRRDAQRHGVRLDAGQGLTAHQTGAVAIVEVLSSWLRFTVDGEDLDAGPGFWLHMALGTPHALTAGEPTVMLLTMIR